MLWIPIVAILLATAAIVLSLITKSPAKGTSGSLVPIISQKGPSTTSPPSTTKPAWPACDPTATISDSPELQYWQEIYPDMCINEEVMDHLKEIKNFYYYSVPESIVPSDQRPGNLQPGPNDSVLTINEAFTSPTVNEKVLSYGGRNNDEATMGTWNGKPAISGLPALGDFWYPQWYYKDNSALAFIKSEYDPLKFWRSVPNSKPGELTEISHEDGDAGGAGYNCYTVRGSGVFIVMPPNILTGYNKASCLVKAAKEMDAAYAAGTLNDQDLLDVFGTKLDGIDSDYGSMSMVDGKPNCLATITNYEWFKQYGKQIYPGWNSGDIEVYDYVACQSVLNSKCSGWYQGYSKATYNTSTKSWDNINCTCTSTWKQYAWTVYDWTDGKVDWTDDETGWGKLLLGVADLEQSFKDFTAAGLSDDNAGRLVWYIQSIAIIRSMGGWVTWACAKLGYQSWQCSCQTNGKGGVTLQTVMTTLEVVPDEVNGCAFWKNNGEWTDEPLDQEITWSHYVPYDPWQGLNRKDIPQLMSSCTNTIDSCSECNCSLDGNPKNQYGHCVNCSGINQDVVTDVCGGENFIDIAPYNIINLPFESSRPLPLDSRPTNNFQLMNGVGPTNAEIKERKRLMRLSFPKYY